MNAPLPISEASARIPVPVGPFEKLSREAINQLPIQAYRGPLHVVRTPDQMKRALKELCRDTVLGFDTETRPAFKKGVSYPPALLQLGGQKSVFIFLLRDIGFPEELAALMASPDTIKTGVAVSGDIRALKALADFSPAGFVDLGTVAKRNGIPHHGLRGLAALLLGFRISKSERFTNWEKPKIPARPLTYAATDAWIGRELYRTMRELGCRGMSPNNGELPYRPRKERAQPDGGERRRVDFQSAHQETD